MCRYKPWDLPGRLGFHLYLLPLTLHPLLCLVRRLGPIGHERLEGLRAVNADNLPARAFPFQADVLHFVVVAVDVLQAHAGFASVWDVR